jgi:casein kinase II subunit alpha
VLKSSSSSSSSSSTTTTSTTLSSDGTKYNLYVLKVYGSAKIQKIIQELIITQLLCDDNNNIIKIYQIGKNRSEDTIMIVEEYVDFMFYHNLYPTLDPNDVKYYSYELLRAINYAHSKGVIHQAIKPSSILIDSKLQKLRLKNWDHAVVVMRYNSYDINPSSPSNSNNKFKSLSDHHSSIYHNQKNNYYRSPEMLLGHHNITFSTDMWSFGCLFAGWIFLKNIFFKSRQDIDKLKGGGQLYTIAKVCMNDMR